MDFLDFFENMGLGVGIIVALAVIIFLLFFAVNLLPLLLTAFGALFSIFISIIAIGAVIYFIGKFAKGFIK